MVGESRSVVVRLSMDTAQALRASKEFGAEVDRAMSQAEKRTSSARGAMDQLGGTARKMGLAAAVGLAAVTVTTANFDEGMSHVAATGDDARSSIDQLREAAIQAGQDTAFSASEAAAGIENLAKAGVSAQDILGGGLSGALDLAAAGGLEVGEAAEVAATALTQFKLEGADVPHVADLLAAAAGKAQGDVSDMSMALKQSGLVASQMGLSLEETTGTLAAFASAGLLGSDAGTSFRTMLLRLANPTQESADLMADLGIQAYDAQGNFVGMAAVSGQLKAALENKTQAERDSALATIFGSDAIRAATVLYDQGSSGISKWTSSVDDAGYAAETAATRMDNLKGDVEQFLGSLETALIGAGDGSQGALRDIVQGGTAIVNTFNKAPDSIQSTATALLAVTAVTGGAAWFGAKVIGGVSDTKRALDDLGYSSERVGRNLKIIGGLAGAATVIIAIEQAAAELVRSTDKAAPSLEGLTKNLLALDTATGAQGVAADLGDLTGAIETLGDPGLALGIGEVYDKVPLIGSAFADIAPGLRGARQEARDMQTSITALDDVLAGVVTSGSPEQATALFEDLATMYGWTAEQQDKLRDMLPGYQEALDGAANAAALAGSATGDYGVSARTAAQATKALDGQIRKSREAAAGTARAFIGLGDSLNDSKQSLGQWLRSLEQQADALRNFRLNAEKAADKGLRDGLIKALQEAGPEGAMRMRQLANATDAEIRRANRAWQSGQREVKRYTDAIGGVPTQVNTKANVNTFDAMAAIARLKNALAQVKSKDVTVRVHYMNIGNKLAGMSDPTGLGRAAGGFVPKTGLPYADRHPYLLADGEGITTNRRGETDRFRDVIGGINAGLTRGQIKGMLADGGFAGGGGVGTASYARVGAGGTPMFALVAAAGDAAISLGNLAGMGKKELTVREKLLKEELDASKQRLDSLRQEREALAQSVKDLIAGGDLFTVTAADGPMTVPDDASQDYRDLVAAHNADLASGAQVTSNLGGLLGEGRERLALIKTIRGLGVEGAALAYLATQPIEVLRELAGSRREARRFERQYNQLQQVAQAGGDYVGSAVYDKRIDAQLDEVRESRKLLHAVNQKLHKLEDIEKAIDDAADREVAALRGVTSDAGRRRGQ